MTFLLLWGRLGIFVLYVLPSLRFGIIVLMVRFFRRGLGYFALINANRRLIDSEGLHNVTFDNNVCEHKNIVFEGMFSMVGSYVCQDCRLKINPIVLHRMENLPHIYFRPEHKKELEEEIDKLDEENLRLWHN